MGPATPIPTTFLSEFAANFFGTTDYAMILVNFIYGCVGMFIMILFDVMGRDKGKYKKFDLGYFWKDNSARFLLNFFIMLVFIRFTNDFISQPPTPKNALLIGFLSDVIVLIVKKRKQKFKEDNENSEKIVVTQETVKKTSTSMEQITSDPG